MSDGVPQLYQAKSGRILDAGGPGRAFCLKPAVKPRQSDVATEQPTQVPGAFPVRVRFKGKGKRGEVLVLDSDVHIYGEDDAFDGFDILDAGDDGDTWAVYVFEHPHAGLFRTGAKSVVPVVVQNTAVAVPTSNPNASTDGWPLRPGLKNFTAFFSNTARTNRLWVRQLNGTWFDTGQDFAAATDPMPTFTVDVPGDRFAFVASGANQNVRIEGKFETG